jgi:glycosyltransferase involved in cell wall biosynthesis
MKAKQTRVLLIYPWLVVGGTLTLFRPVVEQLKRRGFSFSAITTRDKLPNMGDTTQDLLTAGCDAVHHLTELAHTDEEIKALFWKILEDGKFNTLVLIGSTLAYDLLPEIKRRYPKMHIVDQLFADGKHVKSNQQHNRYIDVTVVPSPLLAEQVKKGAVESNANLSIIPHGLRVPTERDQEEARRLGASQLPRAKNKFVVSFFARLSPEKCPEAFVELVSRLRDLPNVFFLMVGDGPERQTVQASITKKGLLETIHFMGFVEQIDPLVSLSDVVIVPSSNDGQPMVVLHTMAHAKPVIASAVGSIPIMVKHGETGYLCDAADIDAFVALTKRLYDDRRLCQALGAAGYRHFVSNFDEQTMIQRYERALQPSPKNVLEKLFSIVGA